MQVDKACSAVAAHEPAFVRPRCKPRITKEHSAAACAAPAQSPPAALNGYDSTALFHHAAYAASYTTRLSNMAGGATSYDRPDLTRQRQDMMDEGLREQARESKKRDLLCLRRHNV